jgi:hypothetical protein
LNILPRNLLRLNLIIAIIVLILPLFCYTYLFAPQTLCVDLFFWKYEMQSYSSFRIFVFMMIQKLYVLLFVSIWFITISDWWKYSLLPIIMSLAYLISDMFFRELGYILIYFFGILLGLMYITVLIFLSKKYQINAIEKVKILVFDMSKLLFLGLKEKKIFIEKRDNFNLEKFYSNTNFHQDKLNLRIKDLQSFLRYKNKSVLNLKDGKDSYHLGFVIIILLSPILFFIHYLTPADTATINIGLFHYETNYIALRIFFYFFNAKLINLILLSIWFFTTKNILKYGIFFNIIIVFFQFVNILDNTKNRVEETELITALPIMIPILITFLLLHKIIKYKSKNDIFNEEIEEEIQEVLTAISAMDDNKNSLVAELISLRENQAKLSKATYQQELLRIKGAIERKIKVK